MEENMRSRYELEREAAEQIIPRHRTTAQRTTTQRATMQSASTPRTYERQARRSRAEPRYQSYSRRAVSRRVEEEAPPLFTKEMLVWQGMVCLILIVAVLGIRLISTEPIDNLRVRLKAAISTQMTWADAGVYFDSLTKSMAAVGDTVKTILGEESPTTTDPMTVDNLPTTTTDPTTTEATTTTQDPTTTDLPSTDPPASVTPAQNYNDAVVDDEVLQQLAQPEEATEKK